MKVISVWWESPKFSVDYVHALKSQVPGLVVLGYDRPLLEPYLYTRWFSKFELFRPENEDLRPCLFFDLDSFVCAKNLEPISHLDTEKFWMIRQFYQKPGLPESGMMLIPKDTTSIWKAIREAKEFHPSGDGHFLRQFCQGFIPDKVDGILSYKVHNLIRAQKPPDFWRVICFHGHPAPHEAKGWALDYWRRHAELGRAD